MAILTTPEITYLEGIWKGFTMTLSTKRRLMQAAIVLVSLWALYAVHLAYESKRDVWDLHHELQDEVNMDENSESLRVMTRDHPDVWEREHPRSYESLIWVFARLGVITDAQAKIYVAFDESCAPDYRIMVKYVGREREPVLTNARIEILGMR
jgi:hypothetical protein